MRRLALLGLLFLLSLGSSGCWLVLIGAGAVVGGAGYHIYDEHHRSCPRCKRQILREATACEHCGQEVTPMSSQEALED
jgi:hypothetical protein